MKHLPFLILVLAPAACGHVGIIDGVAQQKTDGGPSMNGTGGAPSGTGGTASSSGGAADTCPTTAFSTAPLPCSQDWTHAKTTYKNACRSKTGGYQASCSPYDAIAYTTQSTDTWCFYEKGTGNLIGSFEHATKGDTCKSFDLHFSLPATASCTPVSGGDCGPDAGP